MLAEYVCEGKVNTEVQLTGEGRGGGGEGGREGRGDGCADRLCLAQYIVEWYKYMSHNTSLLPLPSPQLL